MTTSSHPAASYGVTQRESVHDSFGALLEELRDIGFCVVPEVLSGDDLENARQRLDAVYLSQEAELGREFLSSIQELDMARLPLAKDDWFLRLVVNEKVLSLVKALVGDYVVLHLQNGIINRPNQTHHQSAWHRDLPYQDWVISKPLAVSALYCIDDFTVETGATFVLPHSHRLEKFPSQVYVEKHKQPVAAKAGSVIVFDSMVFHRAGANVSGRVRRGINHVYTIPLLKQQIDLPVALGGRFQDDPALSRLLGYESQVPASVAVWRNNRHRRLSRQRDGAN